MLMLAVKVKANGEDWGDSVPTLDNAYLSKWYAFRRDLENCHKINHQGEIVSKHVSAIHVINVAIADLQASKTLTLSQISLLDNVLTELHQCRHPMIFY